MKAKDKDIIKIKDDYDAYGMLAGEIYVVGYKKGKLVALPKYDKNRAGLNIDEEEDYDIIGNTINNPELIPPQYKE